MHFPVIISSNVKLNSKGSKGYFKKIGLVLKVGCSRPPAIQINDQVFS